ncbi:MAG TPA: radical SAM protein [Terriglobales bacterium]|nr:radical SAM protein [Terriglobales bacterium]
MKGRVMLTAIHVLLTYQCTSECDHCFLHCGPAREGTFTLSQLRELLREIKKIGTIDTVYFEGGEPFLFYAVLLAELRMVRDAGLQAGIVTNGYWATSLEDAEQWLRPMLDLGIADFSVSDDAFHSTKGDASPGAIAYRAAKKLGFPCAKICISPPTVSLAPDPGGDKGQPVTGGGVLFKGRAAEKLTAGLPVRRWRELITCPHEELANPERVHVDAYGNVHVCQGVSIGNMWSTPLSELVREYDASKHPIVGPLVEGGPARLAERFGVTVADAYVDECHLCYMARKSLLPAFPEYLAPAQVYGL